jgi:hemin uptake protein HemP
MDGTVGEKPGSSQQTAASSVPPTPIRVDSAQLFNGRDEVRLIHRGQEYRLRITRQGKLILTK